MRMIEVQLLFEDGTAPELSEVCRIGANEIERLENMIAHMPKPATSARRKDPTHVCVKCGALWTFGWRRFGARAASLSTATAPVGCLSTACLPHLLLLQQETT